MSRNKYEAGAGVARLRWRQGDPPENNWGIVLVEVWTPEVQLVHPHPRISVNAAVQLRRYRGGWQFLSHAGDWTEVRGIGKVRRWSVLPQRSWYGSLLLDGWTPEPEKP